MTLEKFKKGQLFEKRKKILKITQDIINYDRLALSVL